MKQIKPTTIAVEFTVEEFKLLTALLGDSGREIQERACQSVLNENIPFEREEVSSLFRQMAKILELELEI